MTDFYFEGNAVVSCPQGHAPIEQIDKPESGRHVVRFDKAVCSACPMVEVCPVRCSRRFYSLSFMDRQVLLTERRRQLSQEGYRSKCRLRSAIEGTVSQFKRRMRNGKLRIRGLSRVRNGIILMAIGINFGRLWTYLTKADAAIPLFSAFVILLAFVLALNLVRQSSHASAKAWSATSG
ncbi:MAG: transposase [Dehalococcoidia bacterium]|nr:transposase [Dehalococcoidia bacterium]